MEVDILHFLQNIMYKGVIKMFALPTKIPPTICITSTNVDKLNIHLSGELFL